MDKITRFLLAAVGLIATNVKDAHIDVNRFFETRLRTLANGKKCGSGRTPKRAQLLMSWRRSETCWGVCQA